MHPLSDLPVLDPGTKPTYTDVDAAARQAAVLAVEHPELRADVLRYLAGLLYCTGLVRAAVTQVVKRNFTQVRQYQSRSFAMLINDLESRMLHLLVSKIVPDPDSGASITDVAMVADGTSFCGHVGSFVRAATLSEWRNLRVEYRQAPVITSDAPHPDVPDDEVHGLMDGSPSMAAEDQFLCRDEDATYTQLLSRFADRHFGVRPLESLQVKARTLLKAYDLPSPSPAPTAADRGEVLQQLDSDPQVAYRVVCAMSRRDVVDSVLAGMFEDWTFEDLRQLASKDPRVADCLARAACSGIPPIHRKVHTELVNRFAGLLPAHDRRRGLAAKTVQAWAKAATTIVGDEFNSFVLKTDEQIAVDEAEFAYQVSRLLSAGMPGFDSADQVRSWLLSMSERIAVEQAERKADRRPARAA